MALSASTGTGPSARPTRALVYYLLAKFTNSTVHCFGQLAGIDDLGSSPDGVRLT